MSRRSQWFKDGKNWVISNTRVLVMLFLIQPEQIKWVKTTLASKVDLCLRPLNWQEWMKLLDISQN